MKIICDCNSGEISMIETTVEEDAALLISNEELAREARAERDERLAQSDWTQLNDAALDASAMVLWQSHRQALRDVPQQPGFPQVVEWPEAPVFE